MKKTVRWLVLILALLLLFGCARDQEDLTPTLSFYTSISTTDIDALTMVSEALDEYVYEKLGFHVQLHTPSDYNQTLADDLRKGTQVDAAMVYHVAQLSSEGLLRPLDDLIRSHGQDIPDVIHESYFEDARLDGQLYAVPTNRDRHTSYGFAYNQTIADQYGLDLSGVESLDDLTPIFAQLKAAAPDVYPSVPISRTTRYGVVDGLGDYRGVLMLGDTDTVVNLFETPAFEEVIRRIYEWNQAGYLLDQTQDGGSSAFYLNSGKVLGCLTEGHCLFSAQQSKLSQADVSYIALTPTYYNSDNASLLGYAIPAASQYPEQAMELLNLLYTDTYAANLLMYGVEGIHYVRCAEDPSVLTYPENRSPEHYTGSSPWQYCNQYAADRWEGYAPDIWEQVESANLSAVRSPAVGFVFDSSAVSRQQQRCMEVQNEYLPLLRAGIVDPDQLLPEFQQALRDAGIDDIVAEKQRQLDLFVQ